MVRKIPILDNPDVVLCFLPGSAKKAVQFVFYRNEVAGYTDIV